MKLTTIVAVAALAATATTCLAQESKPMGLSVKLGIFWPSSAVTKAEGKTWIGFGVDYKLGDLKFGSKDEGYSSSYTISIDYLSKGDFRTTPILLNFVGRRNQIYYFAGGGIALTRAREGVNEVRNHTEFAYQLGVGYDFTQGNAPLFAELKYLGNSDSRLAGFGAFVGIRF